MESEDHDLVRKHEQQLNDCKDGIVSRVNILESWQSDYLLKEREESCYGCNALKVHIESETKAKGDEIEMTKTNINSKTLILVALVSAVPNLFLLVMSILKK
jgi:hypothetical protein